MKSIFKIGLLAVAVLISFEALSQFRAPKDRTPKWISNKGFWQIESNIQTPKKNVVYFYNNEKVLIYRERLDNVSLRLEKYRVKMRLKKALEAAIVAWNKDHIYQSDQQLVSLMFSR